MTLNFFYDTSVGFEPKQLQLEFKEQFSAKTVTTHLCVNSTNSQSRTYFIKFPARILS